MTKLNHQGEGLNDKNTNLKIALKGIHKKLILKCSAFC